MTSVYDLRANFDTVRSIDSATFTGAYQAVGTPLTHPIRLVKFVNDSSVLVTVSLDGVNAHDVLPANSFALYDITANEIKNDGFFVANNTQFYAKGAAGVRSFYIICIS